jgi:hypothetical protein
MDKQDNNKPQTPPQTESNTNKKNVSNHLAIAIISLFFFVPFGIPALIYAVKVNNLLLRNDTDAAKKASKKAKMWSLIAIGTWAVLWLGILALIVFVGLSTKVEQKLATSFVTDVSNGRTSEAYSQFSSALKDAQDQPTFENSFSNLNLNKSCKLDVSGLKTSSSTDLGNTTEVSGTVKCDDKTFNTVVFIYNVDGKLVEYGIAQ